MLRVSCAGAGRQVGGPGNVSLPASVEVLKRLWACTVDQATSELFHSEFKTDLDLERLPSSKFDTNNLVMAFGPEAHRAGCGGAPPGQTSLLLTTVRQEQMAMACGLVLKRPNATNPGKAWVRQQSEAR